ncbi:related to alpha-L-rhamnosidase C [Ustilago trichophora]|uniref:Related to alpha-L-rhamnosidase C n=1 Tax=Ustilago trichophora TaxID=86804 RepID=A0A5C3EDW5_9BASI|nr:related to alpha-L-rhamnosidase C [Ustilago trichophora]
MKIATCLGLVALAWTPYQALALDQVQYASIKSIKLKSNGETPDIQIVDFGENFEGHPTFEVVSASGNTSILEVSYAEERTAFDSYMSDGPITMAAAMDSYRVKRFNISKPEVFENRLIQGGFRYQKFNLSSAGELELAKIGSRATVHSTPIKDLPGGFESSDEDITRIWSTGARTAQLTEIPSNTIPDFWLVTSDGSFVEALAPQNYPLGATLTDYSVSVNVKPNTGAFVIGVRMDTLNAGLYISVDVVQGTVTAINSDKSTAIANATFEPLLSTDFVPAIVSVQGSNVTVSISNRNITSFSQDDFVFGSFGLGAPFAHSATFKNLEVTDATSGAVIYANALTNRTFLTEFLMGNNPLNTIVDGSRRDRIAYNGDLDVSIGVNLASTCATEFIDGSIDLLGSYRLSSGPFVPTAKIQQPPLPAPLPINSTGLIGYSFNLVCAMAQAHFYSGNQSFAEKWAPVVVSMLDWADSKLEDGLFTLNDSSLVGDWNYYDPPQTGASAKFNTLYAYALQQSNPLLEAAGVNTTVYESRLTQLRKAINDRLWNSTLNAYVVSSEITDGFAQDAQAFAILAGVPQSNDISPSSILQTMDEKLLLETGPLSFSPETEARGFSRKISPYASSYHLRAALEAGDGNAAKKLLKNLWAPMANPTNQNYTNCMWETLSPDGTPGLGQGTSLCHGWGAGPTSELNKYVLGVTPTAPGFEKWQVKPITLGLTSVSGRQPTPKGTVNIAWNFNRGLLNMQVDGPQGGELHLPNPLPIESRRSTFVVNDKVVQASEFPIRISGRTVVKQRKNW